MHGTIENFESTLVTVVVMSPGPEDASAGWASTTAVGVEQAQTNYC